MARSSEEAPVMGVEWSEGAVLSSFEQAVNRKEGAHGQDKVI